MIRRFVIAAAATTVFLAGAYAETGYHLTPVVTAFFSTMKILLGDLYATVSAHIPGQIETTPALAALAGFGALLSLRYLARYRRM